MPGNGEQLLLDTDAPRREIDSIVRNFRYDTHTAVLLIAFARTGTWWWFYGGTTDRCWRLFRLLSEVRILKDLVRLHEFCSVVFCSVLFCCDYFVPFFFVISLVFLVVLLAVPFILFALYVWCMLRFLSFGRSLGIFPAGVSLQALLLHD